MSISAYFYIERDKQITADHWKVFTDNNYRFWSFYKKLEFNDVYTNNALAWYLSEFTKEASPVIIHNKPLFFDNSNSSNRSRCWSKEVEDFYISNQDEFTGLGTMYLDDFVNNDLWDKQSTSNELVRLINIKNVLKDNGKIDYRKLHFSTFETTGNINLIPFSQVTNKINEMLEVFNNPDLYSNDMYDAMRKYENMYTMMKVNSSPRMYCKMFFDTFKDEFKGMLSDYKYRYRIIYWFHI